MRDVSLNFCGHRAKSRIVLWMTLAIILIRGLLSNVVMFDAHAADGSFGLVICSGHGPMFRSMRTSTIASPHRSASTSNDPPAPSSMAGMTMAGASMPSAAPPTAPTVLVTATAPASATDAFLHSASDDRRGMDMAGGTQDDNGICPFSAILFAALVTFAVLLLFFVATTQRQRFRHHRTSLFAKRTLYRLALTRAPPLTPTH